MSDDGKTRIIRRDAPSPAAPANPGATRVLPVRQVEQTVKVGAPASPAPEGAPAALPGMQETRRINIQLPSAASAANAANAASAADGGDDATGNRTRLFRPGAKKDATAGAAAAAADGSAQDADWDPVTGWVVVVNGPGKGRAIALGIGQNTLGRGPDQRARIDFGDNTISRETHATISFDPKGGRFYIAAGTQARNLIYLNKTPVLQATPLQTGDEIEIGGTLLRFCAFCSEQFKWDEA